jgi:hypothetical protein
MTHESDSIPRNKMTKSLILGPESSVKLGWILGGVFTLLVVVVGPCLYLAAEVRIELRQMNKTLENVSSQLTMVVKDYNSMDRRLVKFESTEETQRADVESLRLRIAKQEKSLEECWRTLREYMIRQGNASFHPGASGEARKEGESEFGFN